MNGTLFQHPDGMGAIHYEAQAQTLCLINDSITGTLATKLLA